MINDDNMGTINGIGGMYTYLNLLDMQDRIMGKKPEYVLCWSRQFIKPPVKSEPKKVVKARVDESDIYQGPFSIDQLLDFQMSQGR